MTSLTTVTNNAGILIDVARDKVLLAMALGACPDETSKTESKKHNFHSFPSSSNSVHVFFFIVNNEKRKQDLDRTTHSSREFF